MRYLFCLSIFLAGCGVASARNLPRIEFDEYLTTDAWTVKEIVPDPMETDEYRWEGEWFYPLSNSQIYKFEKSTEAIANNTGYTLYRKWRKVPYKIEWHCAEWETPPFGTLWTDIYIDNRKCAREEGYREDGAVVWRKVKP